MRVVAGIAGGRRLVAPRGDGTRPTSDRVKEAWFSSLAPVLPGASVLDLFAGSGALGIEALSRGAAHATFVDNDRHALAAIRANLETTALAGRADVVAMDCLRALQQALVGAPFDIVVADPPYRLEADRLAACLQALAAHLAAGALVVVEQSSRDGPPPWPRAIRHDRTRKYGDTALHTGIAADQLADPLPDEGAADGSVTRTP